MPQWWSVPNALTILRLGCVPFLVMAVLNERHALALGLFFAAAATDGVDGWLARRLKQVTAVGAYLDPVADKILMGAVYIVLAITGRVPWWLVWLIFGRDVFILLGAGLMLLAGKVRHFPPSMWGKLSTLSQSVLGVSLLIRNLTSAAFVDWFCSIMIWVVAAATVWSGVQYAWAGGRYMMKKEGL